MAKWIFLAATLLAVAHLAACAPVAAKEAEAVWTESESTWTAKRAEDGEAGWRDQKRGWVSERAEDGEDAWRDKA